MSEVKSISEAAQRTFEPETRICLDCGHKACPHCRDWCDVLANNEDEIKEYGVNDIGDKHNVTVFTEDGKTKDGEKEKFPVLCCGGGCRY